MPPRRPYRRRNARKRAPKGRKAISKPRRKAVRNVVNKEMDKRIETHEVISHYPLTPLNPKINGTLATAQPAAPATSASIWNLCPQVLQGATATQRDGLSVNPVSLRINGFIYLPPSIGNDSANTENMSGINVRFYVLSSKKISNYTSLGATGGDPTLPANTGYSNMVNRLLYKNGSVGGYTGQIDAHTSFPTNTHEVTVHKMRNYHLSRKFLLANVAGYQDAVKVPFSFRVPTPKHLLFNTDAKATPQKYAPMCVAGWCYDNGASPSSDANLAPKMILTTTLKYKDP